MWPRSFGRLAELPDNKLFPELETGLTLLAKNVECLAGAAEALSQARQSRPARILGSHADDEAGKFLLLLDAARCPRDRLANHLKRAKVHLPRLLYAESSKLSPATFGELVKYINRERDSLYLDGYEGIEYIYRNQILYWREQALYVDYVRHEDGRCEWEDPDRFEWIFGTSGPFLIAPGLVAALAGAGLHRAPALEAIASIWRSVEPTDAMHITEHRELLRRTLGDLENHALLVGDGSAWQRIFDSWTFPLWAVELTEREVKTTALLEERARFLQSGDWEGDW